MSADPAGRLRIVLIDDHTLLREAIREALDAEPDMTVVNDTASGAAAVRYCQIERPEVVLLDVNIPGESVIETVRAIRAVSPGTRILIVSVQDDPVMVRLLLDCGVRGYLLKSVSRTDLMSSIRAVCADDHRIVLHVSAGALACSAPAENHTETLTRRELEVLTLLSEAMSNRQISQRLQISEGTVKRHVGAIFSKLGTSSRLAAVNKATATGLISPPGRKP